MAKVAARCPNCGTLYKFDETRRGKKARCRKCKEQGRESTFVLEDFAAVPPQVSNASSDASEAVQSEIPQDWEPGDTILDQYEVRPFSDEVPFVEGGMGRVNRVWHRGWNTELAVKSVKPEYLARKKSAVEGFKPEAEVWIDKLGLHPHIVSCYYVRILAGSPRVFVEYIDGGSLKEWIDSGRLYERERQEVLKRILDISIQFAWGLQYAHDQGLIHQDVKPANVMMTKGGIAKVTDFGLANARAETGREDGGPAAGQTLLATWGGMTPAYASPEQVEIQTKRKAGAPRDSLPKLTRRTDIWSWAVSVLEMFLGKIAWPSGSVAHVGLKRRPDNPDIPEMPAVLRELLERCFQRQPEARPANFAEVAGALHKVYSEVAGAEYARRQPTLAKALAATLNNRAVSLFDLGKTEEAENLWQQALETDPLHAESTYNLDLTRWRSAKTDDATLLHKLEAIRNVHPNDWLPRYCLGQVHLERGDCATAIEELQAIQGDAVDFVEVQTSLGWATEQLEGSRRCLHTFDLEPGVARAANLSKEGQLVLWDSSGVINVWETETGKCLRTIRAHKDRIRRLSLSADGRLALSISAGDFKVWDTESGCCLLEHQSASRLEPVAALSSDGRVVLLASAKSLKVWEMPGGHSREVQLPEQKGVPGVSLSHDGRVALLSSGSDSRSVGGRQRSPCVYVPRPEP